MSNKRLLKIIGILVAVGLFVSLSGCGTAKTGTGESTITILIAEDPPSFNAMISDTGYDSLVMELVMLGLTDVDPQGNVLPELAAELPTVDNGGVAVDDDAGTMEVTWKMRDDIQWSDSKPVTADDVIFTWNAILDPEMGTWIPGIDYIDSLEKVDDYTFKIMYNTIYPAYLTQLGGEQLVIWPAHYCKAEQGFSAWDCGRQPLSDGPYTLTEWVTGDHLSFTRNPKYYQQGKPAIENVVVRIVPDATVRKTMMINGDADINMWVTEQVIGDMKNSGKVGVSISPNNRWVVRLFMNQAAKGTVDPVTSPHPVLSDVRVRQAIRAAIDVDTISKQIFYGYGVPVWNEFFRPPYACDIPRPKFDIEAAKSMLEQAGWTDTDGDGVRECHGCLNAPEGYKMEMDFITYAEFGEPLTLTHQFIAEALGRIGMKLNLSVIQGSVMWADTQSGGTEQTGNFDIDLWDDGYGGFDPTDYIWEIYASDAATPDYGWNIVRWQNEEFNNLLNESYTLDEDLRKDNFCRMAQILDEQLPNILMFSAVNADAYSLRLQGVQSSSNDLVTWNIADWQIAK